nr:VIER F-box protein 2 [Tanacetum cinerariifolium]
MLDRTDFASWQQRIRLYCRGKDNGVNILKSIDEGSKLINDMRNIKMAMPKLQLNSKFVNNMLPEWGRFVTAVKLNRELRESNYDQLNQATVQDGRVVVQNVKGRPNRGQGMNPWGGNAARYEEAQNRVGNVNQGQARPALDAEQLAFPAGGPDNAFDDDVDEQPDSDILSEVRDHDQYLDDTCTYQEEHMMHDSVQLDHVVDLHADHTSISNMIPYDHYYLGRSYGIFFNKFYPPSHNERVEKANVVEMLWDLNNNEFKKWLASNFENYMMMDHITMNALWKFWSMNNDQEGITFRRIDGEVNNKREPCNDRIEISENESKVAEIFRIETNVFDYESPVCKAFDEFNYLFKINPDVLTKDIPGFKTYEKYKNDWIYEWNDKIPWVSEKPWVPDGTWKEANPVKHYCKPFNYKNGCSEWLTCSWKDDGRCNRGNFLGQYLIGNQIDYQDYEWYEALVDCELKDKAQRNKAELEKSIDHDRESSDDV